MGTFREIDGDLIKLAKEGKFDVIAHGCNCHSKMGAGLAPQMAKAFGCDRFPMELGGSSINKLGNIDYQIFVLAPKRHIYNSVFGNPDGYPEIVVVNAYTQYNYGRNHTDGDEKPLDYDALTLVMKKINHEFKGKHIGLPKIGAGLAGGDWFTISQIIEGQLKDCDVTIVNYKK